MKRQVTNSGDLALEFLLKFGSGFCVALEGKARRCTTFSAYDFCGPEGGCYERIQVLALATLFLATMFAETEWKEFTSSKGNFRVVFPRLPNKKVTERNLHRFSAAVDNESYGLTYADYLRARIGKPGERRA